MWICFCQIFSNFLKMKRTGVVAKSKKFFFNLQTHWKTAFSFLSLVKTNDNFGDFFSNFQGLSWQKKLKVEFDLDLLDNGTQNLTFFSQFVKIVKVSSLDLSRFHGILRHKIWKVSPFFLEKADFFFFSKFSKFSRFSIGISAKKLANFP